MNDLKISKLAKYFPILEGEEFDLLVDDIKNHGQQEAIIMFDDEILDGVNRYRACRKLGIEPKTKKFTGDDPLAYVVSINVRRRHLTEDQRAMLATEMLPLFEAKAKERKEAQRDTESGAYRPRGSNEPSGKARDDAAQVFGVSGIRVQRAKRIKDKAPEKVDDIVKGKTTITAVDNEIREREEKERHDKAVKEGRTEKTSLEVTVEQQEYLLALDSILLTLPKSPPKDWNEKTFKEAKGKANIIIRRLEVFNE